MNKIADERVLREHDFSPVFVPANHDDIDLRPTTIEYADKKLTISKRNCIPLSVVISGQKFEKIANQLILTECQSYMLLLKLSSLLDEVNLKCLSDLDKFVEFLKEDKLDEIDELFAQ